MRPPDLARLTIEPPAPARLVGVGLDRNSSGVVQVVLAADQQPFTLALSRADAIRLLDVLADLVATLPVEPEPNW